MDFINNIRHLIDPHTLVQTGYIGLSLIIFAESGLFFGFFLPGDSLLLVAGILASSGSFNLFTLCLLMFVAAFLGDQVGYWTGNKFGRQFFHRENNRFFKKKYVLDAEEFFEKHGNKTIVLARFIPIVRTFTPIVAGIANMPYKIFVTYNALGAFLWAVGLTIIGYLLGNIPNIDKYLHILIAAVIIVSFIPPLLHIFGPDQKKSR